MDTQGQNLPSKKSKTLDSSSRITDFVLDKFIFSNVFEKDIRRIYIYRKSERLAKAIQLITPAFGGAPSLRNRLDAIAVGLIDAAILPPTTAREALSRELLALSSILSVARIGGLLSDMNADLITREAHTLLQEIASYEGPRLFLEDAPTLAELAKRAPDMRETVPATQEIESMFREPQSARERQPNIKDSSTTFKRQIKGHLSSALQKAEGQTVRQEAVLSILRTHGPSYIKDISMVIRDVSEKTIQRELQSLVSLGLVSRTGERRWTQYALIEAA
jgi:Fic family protein